MLLPIAAVIFGIILLVISADKFVDGAASVAKRLGLPPLLIGMLVIGFGSSMPEMVISALSASQGNTGLALGNAFGSNITNIALILGLTAALSPVRVESTVLRRELPLLAAVTLATAALLYNDSILSRLDGGLLIGLFALIMAWSIYAGLKNKDDKLGAEVAHELEQPMAMSRALIYVGLGLTVLVISSRILVWGGVEIAQSLGISDLIIGLTIVAVGTSLPELASSIAAVRKNEHDLALGNIIGSNLFNSSLVVGITASITPAVLEPGLLSRDIPVMVVLTAALFIMGYSFKRQGPGIISRAEGGLLLLGYIAYNFWLTVSVLADKQ